jgi:hypothetical protein
VSSGSDTPVGRIDHRRFSRGRRQPLKCVGSTADAFVKWLTSTSDFAILAKPKTVTVGDGVKGKQLTLTTSNSANFGWDDCPDNPHCAAIFTVQAIGVAASMRSEAPRSHGSSSRPCTTRKATTRSLSRSMRSVLAILQRSPARHSRSSTASACPRSISGTDGHPKRSWSWLSRAPTWKRLCLRESRSRIRAWGREHRPLDETVACSGGRAPAHQFETRAATVR